MELLPQLCAVLGVFALLGLTLWWLRKRGALQMGAIVPFRSMSGLGGNRKKVLERLDALQLSPTHSLNLVRMADRAILIGTSPSGFYLVESGSWKTLQTQIDAAPESSR